MKKTTKGALAAAGAAVLLTGGAGTLAFWNDAQTVQGTSVEAGYLKLGLPSDGVACGAWTVTNGNSSLPLVAATRLVPGDTVTRVCNYKTLAVGDNLKATVAISAPGLSKDGSTALNGQLDLSGTTATYQTTGAAAPLDFGTPVTVTNGGRIVVTYVAKWDFGTTADNSANVLGGGLKSTLDDLSVSLTQVS